MTYLYFYNLCLSVPGRYKHTHGFLYRLGLNLREVNLFYKYILDFEC